MKEMWRGSIRDIILDLLDRNVFSHKGDYGTVLVVGGSSRFRGCVILASRASFRVGCGKVILSSTKEVIDTGWSSIPEAIFVPIEEACSVIREGIVDVIALGPGLGRNREAERVVKDVIAAARDACIPVILDADGFVLALSLGIDVSSFVLTPHLGEFALVSGLELKKDISVDEKVSIATDWANKWNAILVLKGYRTVVSDERGRYFINSTGGPSLSVAGAGDVLLGMIAGFFAQMKDGFLSSVCGVYLHGICGDMAEEKLSVVSVMPSDIVDIIPYAISFVAKGG